MSETTQRTSGPEPSLQTVEILCDRLAELGLAVGADTARALAREILASEAPRMDARLRDALDTTLQTIRVAAQSAMGLLATTASDAGPKAPPPSEQLHVSRRPPAPQPSAHVPRKTPPPEPKRPEPRPSGPRRPRVDLDEDERRPVFRRPGRR